MTFDALYFTDQQDTQIQLGDNVAVTKGPYKGRKFIFVFSIPQHRFGFLDLSYFTQWSGEHYTGEPYILNVPHLRFYYTPRSVKEIIKL